MSIKDARSNLTRFSGGSAAQKLCDDEGRREFRRAVVTFSAAADAAGEGAPSADALVDDAAWRLVGLGVVSGLVRQSDLSGKARSLPSLYAARFALAQHGLAAEAVEAACPEFMTFYGEASTYAQISADLEASAKRSDSERDRLQDRARQQAKRLNAAAETVKRRLRSAGWVVDANGMVRKP